MALSTSCPSAVASTDSTRRRLEAGESVIDFEGHDTHRKALRVTDWNRISLALFTCRRKYKMSRGKVRAPRTERQSARLV